MAQWLRMCTTLAEGPGLVPDTHTGWLTTLGTPTPEDPDVSPF